jgi:signal transduction histidine kinase
MVGPGTRRALLASTAFVLLYALWLILRLGGEEGLRYLSEVVFQFPPMLAAAACAFAALRCAGRERLGWAAFAAGNALWAAAEWIWSGYDLFFRTEPPLFSVADPVYYLGYPFLMLGVMLLVVPPRGSRLDAKSLLDALLLVAVLSVVALKWLLTPIYHNTEASTFDVLVTFSYPVLDLALLAAIVFAFYRAQGTLGLVALLLAVGAILTTVADIIYLYLATVSGYDILGNPLELAWVMSYLAFGVAAVARVEERRQADEEGREAALSPGQQRAAGLALPYLALLPLLGASTHSLIHGHADPAVSAGIILAVALVVSRQFLTLAENVHLYNRVLEHDGARRRLLDRVVAAQEEERRRIAVELHDRPVQSMSSIALRLGAARRFLRQGQPERAAEILAQAESKLGEETQGLRDLMGMLHPPILDERGVESALDDYVQEFSRETGIPVQFESRLPERLDRSHETIVYRIVQEALTNVRKHSRATSVTVGLEAQDGQVRLEVADDGIGFEPKELPALVAQGHFGLMSMRQRAELAGGSCTWASAPQRGTQVIVSIPLSALQEEEARAA